MAWDIVYEYFAPRNKERKNFTTAEYIAMQASLYLPNPAT